MNHARSTIGIIAAVIGGHSAAVADEGMLGKYVCVVTHAVGIQGTAIGNFDPEVASRSYTLPDMATNPGDADRQRVQRMVLAALRPEPVREPEEVRRVNLVQHGERRSLDNLVFERGDRQRALSAIGLGYVNAPRWKRPVRPPMDPTMQIDKLRLEIGLVVLPCQAVDACGGVALQGVERLPQSLDIDMMEKRREPFLLP